LPRASASGVKKFELELFDELHPQFLKADLDFWIPDEWKDFKVGWQLNLMKASLRSRLLGYIPLCEDGCKGCPACLYRLAGSHRRDFWDANKSEVLNRWERSQIAGQNVLYFPPLVECLKEQLKLYRSKKTQLQAVVGKSRRSRSLLTSQFSFEFEDEKNKKPVLSEKLRARQELEQQSSRREAIAHYRLIGMHAEADRIEREFKVKRAGAGGK
jgi:hypothetical protein